MSPITIYKVSYKDKILFESIYKDHAVTFAQRYYSEHDIIPEINAFLRTPRTFR